jgi:hypothetical protein
VGPTSPRRIEISWRTAPVSLRISKVKRPDVDAAALASIAGVSWMVASVPVAEVTGTSPTTLPLVSSNRTVSRSSSPAPVTRKVPLAVTRPPGPSPVIESTRITRSSFGGRMSESPDGEEQPTSSAKRKPRAIECVLKRTPLCKRFHTAFLTRTPSATILTAACCACEKRCDLSDCCFAKHPHRLNFWATKSTFLEKMLTCTL